MSDPKLLLLDFIVGAVGRDKPSDPSRPHIGTEGDELADRIAMLGVQSKEKELRLYQERLDIPPLLKMRAG